MNETSTTLECIQMFTKREKLALQLLKVILKNTYAPGNEKMYETTCKNADYCGIELDEYIIQRAFDRAEAFLKVSKERSEDEN